MGSRNIVRAVRTPVTLVLLLALLYLAAQWGWDAARAPVPPRPLPPCVVKQIGPTLTPEHVYVQVYNGSKRNGVAKRLGQILSADGFKVIKRINADRDDYATSEIVGHSENSPEVVLVRQAFEDIPFRADGRADRTVDVIIGEKQPVPRDTPQLSVTLPDGTACLPDIQLINPNG